MTRRMPMNNRIKSGVPQRNTVLPPLKVEFSLFELPRCRCKAEAITQSRPECALYRFYPRALLEPSARYTDFPARFAKSECASGVA
jgi:hypothetical protein